MKREQMSTAASTMFISAFKKETKSINFSLY